MDDKFRSRKFMLAMFFTITGSAALVGGQMSGGEYVGLASLILTAYGISNVGEKWVNSNYS